MPRLTKLSKKHGLVFSSVNRVVGFQMTSVSENGVQLFSGSGVNE